MSEREWEVGDVASIRCGTSDWHRAMRIENSKGEAAWYCMHGGGSAVTDLYKIESLVVIDPEDREQVKALAFAYLDAAGASPSTRAFFDEPASVDQMQSAIRNLVTPPKPPEPTNVGAVVEDRNGHIWVRIARCSDEDTVSPPWRHRGHAARHWDHVTAVKVLSEGVTA